MMIQLKGILQNFARADPLRGYALELLVSQTRFGIPSVRKKK